MPEVFAFRAIQFAGAVPDRSTVIAPPYDVLDSASKAALLTRDSRNIVAIDLPHTPAKELGPPGAYAGAGDTLGRFLSDGTLVRNDRPALFAYRQTYEFQGKSLQRCGVCCTIETAPFGPREGGGVLPHEQTFSGPKEDRMALMKATGTQLSPIFGLHPDESGRATTLARAVMDSRAPDMTGTTDDRVLHEVWRIDDDRTIHAYQDALAGEDVFIADGHHRYNTALNYLHWLEQQGPVAADHPARRCMIVLVGMSDPGLAIGPTHRVLGGMEHYSIERFEEAAQGLLEVKPCDNDPMTIEQEMAKEALATGRNVFGVIDLGTGLCFTATTAEDDPLADRFENASHAWRTLDAALVQHLIVEQICEPELNDGKGVKWAFPHSIQEVMAIARGEQTGSGVQGGGPPQLALILRPTPLDAVREISRAGELMPQKSTFFYPKLATGLWINPLQP